MEDAALEVYLCLIVATGGMRLRDGVSIESVARELSARFPEFRGHPRVVVAWCRLPFLLDVVRWHLSGEPPSQQTLVDALHVAIDPKYTDLLTGYSVDFTVPVSTTGMPVLWGMVRLDLNRTATKLLNAGADPNIRNSAGVSPIDYAIEQSSWSCVMTLIEHGARPTNPAALPDRLQEHLPDLIFNE